MTVWLIFNFGRTVVRSVFYCGLFKTFKFFLISLAFSGGKERHTSQNPNVLVGLRRPHTRREIVWPSALNLKDLPCNGDPRETVDRVHAKYFLLKGAFMSKNIATFVQKWA